MQISPQEQIIESLSRAKKILVALPEKLTADSVSSALALALFLRKLDKDVEVASSGKVPANLKFLPGAEDIKSDAVGGKSLVVTVDTSEKELEEISYQKEPGRVSIFLKTKQGVLAPEDVSFSSDKFPVDIIVVLDCRTLEDLGQLFDRQAELFYETPKINIDHQAGNNFFGSINLVDLTASSVAEILSFLFEKFEDNLLDEDIATCLLAGIITKTNSFQHVQTTPRAFLKASHLVSLGGRQQEVVKNIFKTRSLSSLKLWGRALARLKTLEGGTAAYSLINQADFGKSGATMEDLPEVLKELAENMPAYGIVAVVAEKSEIETQILAALQPHLSAEQFAAKLQGHSSAFGLRFGSYHIVSISLSGASLALAEARLTEAIRDAQGAAAGA